MPSLGTSDCFFLDKRVVMRIEIWSDIACPWCYVGKRRFEKALSQFEYRAQVEVVWKSFELDPIKHSTAPAGDYADRLARKYGKSRLDAEAMLAVMTETAAAEGLDFRFDQARPANTFDAHRLLHLAATQGLQDALKERFFRGYFTDGEQISDSSTLQRLAVEVGLGAQTVRRTLEEGTYGDAVRQDEEEASELGIRGVPCFVIDRAVSLSGAQSPEAILEMLRRESTERGDSLSPSGSG